MTTLRISTPILSDTIGGCRARRDHVGHKLIVVLLVAGSLCGCATYEAKPIVAAESAARLEARRLDDPGLRDFIDRNQQRPTSDWPLSQWAVDELTLAAFYYHPALDVARARWAVASAGRVVAGERTNPSLSTAPAYNTSSDIPSPWIVAAAIDMPLTTAGKRGARIAEAESLAESARFNIASVAWQLRSRVRSSLVDLYAAREMQRLLQQQQALEDENVRLLERQYEAGAVSSFELTQARLRLNDARLAVLEAGRASAESRVRLADAVGVPVAALDGLAFEFESLGKVSADLADAEIRRRALANRADVLGALAEYAASQAVLQRQIANQYPDIAIGPGYEYDQGDNKWSLGLSLVLPIVNRNRGAIAEAEALREESAARFEALQARVLTEIDVALAGYRAALQSSEATNSMLAEMSSQESSSQAMFAAGELSRSELLGLELQLSASAIARFDALINAQRAAGMLEDALQLPLDVPAAAWQTPPRNTATAEERP